MREARKRKFEEKEKEKWKERKRKKKGNSQERGKPYKTKKAEEKEIDGEKGKRTEGCREQNTKRSNGSKNLKTKLKTPTQYKESRKIKKKKIPSHHM